MSKRLILVCVGLLAAATFSWRDSDEHAAPPLTKASRTSSPAATAEEPPSAGQAAKSSVALLPTPEEHTPPRFTLRYEEETAPERLRPPPVPLQSPLNEMQRFFRVIVESADVLKADDTTIRLAGLDAPEPDETCSAAQGEPWPCGRMGQAALARLIRSRAVECRFDGRDADGTLLGRCTVAGTDINEWVVRRGWARSTEDSTYSEALTAAKEEGTGLWGRGR